MAQTIIAIKKLGALRPVDKSGMEIFDGLKEGKQYTVEIKLARNPRQHRLYWALIDMLYGQQSRYATKEDLSDALKCAVGYCNEIETESSRVIMVPKSIAYHAMPQEAFQEFFDKIIDLVVSRILPGVSNKELRAELEAMVS